MTCIAQLSLTYAYSNAVRTCKGKIWVVKNMISGQRRQTFVDIEEVSYAMTSTMPVTNV
jgi:hypothetical protein